jgi:hypothetical protein
VQRVARGSLILALIPSVVTVGDGQDPPPTPAEQYAALRKEDDVATSGGAPLTDPERLQFVGRVYQHHFAVAARFLELAEKHPEDPIALDALIQAVWQVNNTPWPVEMVGEDVARPRAFELLSGSFTASPRSTSRSFVRSWR